MSSPEELLGEWGAACVTKDDAERRRLFESCTKSPPGHFKELTSVGGSPSC